MNAIRSFLPVQVNTLLVSATRITYLPEAWSSDNYDVLQFQSDDKPVHLKTYKVSCLDIYEELKYCLSAFKNEPSVIFCNYREVAENLSNRLKDEGFTYTLYHGGLTQAERELALVKFKNGSVLSLVCTDLGARGLDISAVKHVVHYQLPDSEATFTHRNGRTARAEQEGNAYIFVKEAYDLPDYLSAVQDTFVPPREVYPVSPQWTTLYFNAGKKDKLRKLDIVGFLTQQGHLKPEEIGRIDLMDFHAYVAIRYDKLKATLPMIKEKRIKRKRIVIKKAK
jgi:superfamily II DNA/RNA helicase